MTVDARRLWQRRGVRIALAVTYAVALSAYLTLGDLVTSFEDDGSSLLYPVLCLAGIAALVLLAGTPCGS